MKYDCHICVDVVTAASCVKYLFKYVTKGADMAKARVTGIDNEIEQYRSKRDVSAAEATWRLFSFIMLNRYPSVTKIHPHLENQHNVSFRNSATSEERSRRADEVISDLMCYFNRPLLAEFENLTILDYFEIFSVTRKKPSDRTPSSPPVGKWHDDQYGNLVSRRSSTCKHVCHTSFQDSSQGGISI